MLDLIEVETDRFKAVLPPFNALGFLLAALSPDKREELGDLTLDEATEVIAAWVEKSFKKPEV